MGLVYTESFIAFEPITGDDSFVTANTNTRNAVAANLRRAGYQVVIGAQAAAASSGGFVTRADPVAPDRVALVHSSGVTTSAAGAVSAAIRKIIPVQSEPLIGGFSLFIPSEYVKAAAPSTVVVMRAVAAYAADANWQVIDVTTATPREVFRITADLLIKWGADAAMSSKVLTPGSMNYIEYRITDGEVRVWIDDTLVMQKTIPLKFESIGVVFENATAGSLLANAAGRWAIGNWYNLVEDALAPNVRLGPTTRVIGVRPTTDVSVQFTKPVGAASNAAVAGQNLVDAPASSLQSVTVGDQDVYTSSVDTSGAGGALVHAIAVKVLAANLESNPHALRPFIRTAAGVEVTDVRMRDYEVFAAITSKSIMGIARRPTDGKVFAVGLGASVFATPANGNGRTWSGILDDGTAVVNRCIAFHTDGVGVIGRSDGKFMVFTAGVDTPVLVNPTVTNSNAINGIVALPNGTFVAVGDAGQWLRSSTPATAGSWTKGTMPTTTSYPVGGVACNAAGLLVAAINSASASFQVCTSTDSGATWTGRGVGVTAGYADVSYDGVQFIIASSSVPTAFRKSSDGTSWTACSTLFNTAVAGGTFNFIASDTTNGHSIAGIGQSRGSFASSNNANDWRLHPQLGAGVNLNDACLTTAGNWLIVGDSGYLCSYTPMSVDNALTPLAGYLPTFNSAALNPTTGLPWTPAEASVSQFGMRLIS